MRGLLREAAEWRTLALLFERPKAGWADEVRTMVAESDVMLSGLAEASATNAREADYLAILGPGGPVSPREAAHRGRMDPAAILADLTGFYGAFRYQPASEDPPDHLAVELGFAGFMRLKEAFAVAAGETEGAEVTREALATFTEAHLAPFSRSVARRLREGESGYLRPLAEALEARFGAGGSEEMDAESARSGPGPHDEEDLHPELDGGCGSGCAGLAPPCS